MKEIKNEKIALNIADGSSMAAFVARPDDKEKHPGIMVFQEAFGVNEYMRDVTMRFAKEGFIAIAPELFHRTSHGFEGNYTDFEGTRKHIQALSEDGLVHDINAAYNWLTQHPDIKKDEIASVGFCMGGRVSFLANTSVKLKAAISFYGANIPSLLHRVDNISAPQLMFWGGQDKHIGKDQVETVTNALAQKEKKFINVVFSFADHGFFCDARQSYNAEAAKSAWALVNSFLDTYIKL